MLDFFWMGWGPDFNDPSNYINPLFTNDVIAANVGQVNDNQVQQWMEEALSETNPTLREALYKNIQQRLIEEVFPYAWGYVPINYDAYFSDLKGFPSNPMNYMYFYPSYLASNPPPTSNIELQNGDIEISEINVGEFFDIYVGDSTDDSGIEQVRFSSDDVQDGIATGEWTDWNDWNATTGDWNHETKIKRWLFATGGNKEVWAEVIDASGQVARDYKNIHAVEVSLLLTRALELSPIKDFYYIGDTLTATFTIKNERNYPITLDVLTVGGRLNGWIPDEGAPDFTHRFVEIMPHEEYRYEGTITLNHVGNYHFFVAYYIENPSPNEKVLLDENNWNTNINLGEGLTHGSRVKNILVLDEPITPDDFAELRDRIQAKLTEKVVYPPYLLDPDAYDTAWISTAWYSITSWLRQEHLVEKYNELYHTGIIYDLQSLQSLKNAKDALNDGFINLAKTYLNDYYKLQMLSAFSFSSASEFFDNSLQKAQELAYKLLQFCLTTFKIGMYAVNPTIAKYLDFVFIPLQFLFEKDLYGLEEAVVKAGYRAYMKFVFTQIPIENGLSIEDLIKNGVDYNFFPIIANIQNDYITQQQIIEVLEAVFTTLPKAKIVDMMYKLGDLLLSSNEEIIQVKSPVELKVFNSEDEVTGIVNGEVKHQISRSFYSNNIISIYFPDD
ncbi:hypothetical protein LCGC14_1068190 [marine sediment metagenome]|uniref:Uncharacterized protein n=1 Tax=marine sediment metagenome TaxID=412755 RepID=A0A0F9Q284_9ZZZZ|nr:hypothetical protein [bacterium]